MGCPVPEKEYSTCKGEGGRGAPGFWCSPPTDSPNPLEEAKLHRRTLGLIYGFTQTEGPGVSGEGIKRWGIEGIRIGTSDRFGRGRGEYGPYKNYLYHFGGFLIIIIVEYTPQIYFDYKGPYKALHYAY